MNNYYILSNNVSAIANRQMNNKAVKNLWNSFFLKEGEISFTPTENFTFCIGKTAIPTLEQDCEYSLCIDENGIAIQGKDYGGLIRGFMSFLLKIEYDENCIRVKHWSEQSNYIIKNRMIHICVFPENDLYFIKKLVRLSALCQYTHIVIEFWGMLKYDCLKELAWENAFTKEQAKELITECRELGIEPIPMFNQLGHATASRVCYGKHVVLDQNPRLQNLFTPDGWAWNIESEKVKQLLKQVRRELYELFGDGEYIHIGCDEAYYITQNDKLRKKLPDFLKEITTEAEKEGRRPMLWMDMLLEEGKFEGCYTVGKADEAKIIRDATAESTVFVDWQYNCRITPIPSLLSLKNSGHDTLGAPWFDSKNISCHIDTVTQNQLFGIMLTTWHTLKDQMPSILDCATKCGAVTFPWAGFSGMNERTATMLRRVSFEGNSYEDSGWSKKQIGV